MTDKFVALMWLGETYLTENGVGHVDEVMACPCCGEPIKVKVQIDAEIAHWPFCSDALDDCVWVDLEHAQHEQEPPSEKVWRDEASARDD